jgi:hypothetical protein
MVKPLASQPAKRPSRPAPPVADPEFVRRARFQNLIWRNEKAVAAHLVSGSNASDLGKPDVPVEWLKELDHR